jgi:hypothetical protein
VAKKNRRPTICCTACLSCVYPKFSDGIFFVRDTVSDLIIDSCGGFFATLLSFKQFGVNDRI